jgi:hypothetical protein
MAEGVGTDSGQACRFASSLEDVADAVAPDRAIVAEPKFGPSSVAMGSALPQVAIERLSGSRAATARSALLS